MTVAEDAELELDIDNDLEDFDDEDEDEATQSTSKRVRMIFSVMASPNRIDILRILNSNGPLTYSELKSLAGFKSKKESGKFAYHLRKLLRQSLVALNKSERRYTITNLGKLVLSLARQIEEHSIIESGKMYVRTSHESIEEFNAHKIIQSLVREAGVPLEVAQRITEETENRIYKYQTAYLTGPLMRELVNSVLLEYGHEEYRNKLARMGLPAYDIQEMISNLDRVDNGTEDLLLNAGQRVFTEHLLTSTLPKDVADSYLSGDLHITNPGTWSVIPDTVFVNIKEIMEGGVDLGGKYLDMPRIPASGHPEDTARLLSIIMSLLSKEVSQEVVLDGMQQLFAKYQEPMPDLEERLTGVFTMASVSKYNDANTAISIRLQLGSDAAIVAAIIGAYRRYVGITPRPRIGLIIDYEAGDITDISGAAAEIIRMGGRVTFARHQASQSGIIPASRSMATLSIILQSVSLNLPRLAFESNRDETYFRARLALLMKPILSSMITRKKDISDLTRRGLNPILAANTQYMQRNSISFVINLVGLREVIYDIFKFRGREAKEIFQKVIMTAMDVASKRGKELGNSVSICMVESDGSDRFVRLDGDKYGRNSALSSIGRTHYSQGTVISASEIDEYTSKSEPISECHRLSRLLNGGLLTILDIEKHASTDEIRRSIEKSSELLSFFRPRKVIDICGECGFKDEPFDEKCPQCKSPYVI